MFKNKENTVNIRNIFCHLNKTVVKNVQQIHGEDLMKIRFNQKKTATFNLI